MGFSHKKLGQLGSAFQRKKYFSPIGLLTGSAVLAGVILILFVARVVWGFALDTTGSFAKNAFKILSQQVGTPLVTDAYGHVNVLIVGYAGDEFRGGKLTDSLMLASFDPDLNTATFLSIPRDLYIAFGHGATGKMNSLYPSMYIESKRDHAVAIEALMEKVTEITGVPVHYYAMVDFNGFVDFVDTLGGVDVDVKEPLYDNQYPGPGDSYVVFQVAAGQQTFDGKTALQFARSRKSTSDFSRSFRQQQIIVALVEKIKSTIGLTNIGALKKLYAQGMRMFKTNIGIENLLRLAQFGEQTPQFFSFVYEANCSTDNSDTVMPGCVLMYGNKDAFGGASVVIPVGATPSNLSYYTKTQDVAHRLIYRQDILREAAPIIIENGIDKKLAKQQGYRLNGVADELGVDLILRGFGVEKITNAEQPQDQTILYTSNAKAYKKTIDALAAFADYIQIVETPQYGSGITLILGNDWLKKL